MVSHRCMKSNIGGRLAFGTTGGFNQDEKPAPSSAGFALPTGIGSSARGGGAFGNGTARGGRGTFRGITQHTATPAPAPVADDTKIKSTVETKDG